MDNNQELQKVVLVIEFDVPGDMVSSVASDILHEVRNTPAIVVDHEARAHLAILDKAQAILDVFDDE